MEIRATPVAESEDMLAVEGRFSVRELQELAEALSRSSEDSSGGNAFLGRGGGNDYCVTCTKPGSRLGKSTTIRAGNGVFAFAMAVKICGSGFSITKGRCA